MRTLIIVFLLSVISEAIAQENQGLLRGSWTIDTTYVELDSQHRDSDDYTEMISEIYLKSHLFRNTYEVVIHSSTIELSRFDATDLTYYLSHKPTSLEVKDDDWILTLTIENTELGELRLSQRKPLGKVITILNKKQ